MSQSKDNFKPLVERQPDSYGTVTDSASKRVMISCERHDLIEIREVKNRFKDQNIPEFGKVARRTEPYFGPQILLDVGGENYFLTAPGPDSELLLWTGVHDDSGFREGWEKLAEVTAEIADSEPYEFCPQCGDPLKTLDHEREAAFGLCNR